MSLFTFIKKNVPILETVQEYTTLKKAGTYWKGTCPLHSEKTASFTVSPDKSIFYCFGCHNGGDIINFIEKVENCSPIQAAQHLIDRYQLDIPEDLGSFKQSSPEKKNHYFALCTAFAQWCSMNAQKNPLIVAYLEKRGINQESIDHFTIGFFPGGHSAMRSLIQYMQKNNILLEDLVSAHLIVSGSSALYSPFQERIIFPITDSLGRFCGFGGRTYKQMDERAKYYNSRENDYFAKGSLLFGFHSAKKAIQKKESVLLVEGYTDCIAMHQNEFANTVATLGTACTIEHLRTLSRYAHTMLVLYDNDAAGQKAALRLTELCWQVNMELKIVPLPDSEDPASFLQKNKDLAPLIEKAVDIFEFFIETLGADFTRKPLREKMELSTRIIKVLHRVQDPLKRDILINRASQVLNIPAGSITKQLTQQPTVKQEQAVTTVPQEADPALEKKIFFAIMNNIQLLDSDNTPYLLEYLPEPFKGVISNLATQKTQAPAIDFLQFYDTLDDETQYCISKVLISFNHEVSSQEFENLVIQLQKKNWKQIVATMKMKLAHAEENANQENIEKILKNFLNLKKKIIHKNLI